MNDLETLRPEVAQALGFIERNQKYGDGSVCAGDIDIIRAELLRLTRENAELRRAWGDTLLTGTGILKVERIDPAAVMLSVEPRPRNETPVPKSEWEALTERAERAEAELATAQNTINAQQDTMGALKRKLALSEGELAALKARIDGSRHAFLGPNMDRITFLAEDIGPVGKYALVKVEE